MSGMVAAKREIAAVATPVAPVRGYGGVATTAAVLTKVIGWPAVQDPVLFVGRI